ncbi:MAG TPA: hypothetical protein VFU54_15355 [Actinomycetota bacterium]|nr:hypothetical protein [Actinomycetota bacterium]
MIGDLAAMRAWLDAHGLGDAELLHSLPNHGLDGADRLTDLERLVLSGLLEARRVVVPGYQPTPADRTAATQDRPEVAKAASLFDTGRDGQRERAAVRSAGQGPRPPGRPDSPATTSRRPGKRDRDEERER